LPRATAQIFAVVLSVVLAVLSSGTVASAIHVVYGYDAPAQVVAATHGATRRSSRTWAVGVVGVVAASVARSSAPAAPGVVRLVSGYRLATKGLTRGEQLLGKSDDIVVLGRHWDTAVAKNWEGHVVLDTPDWSLQLNDDFIAGAIKQRRRVYLASSSKGNLVQRSGPFAGQETIYARELRQLKHSGYRRNGDYLEPPG